MKSINFLKRKINFKTVLLTLTSLFFGFAIYYGTMAQVSRPELCTVCHMMKPEYYSWQASSHSQISCYVCHQLQKKQDFVRSSKRLYLTVTGTYADPIKALTSIDDKVCEGCHKLNRRKVTASGDVIIPHDVHKKEKVTCVRCHRAIVHGSISDREVTFRSDYDKWDSSFGKTLMTEEFYRPKMEDCMRCHKSRGAPLDCLTCHRTRMLPNSHKPPEFRNGAHGQKALENLKYCDSCHGYMSQAQYTDFQEQSAFSKYISNLDGPKKEDPNARLNKYRAASSYAKTNDYCKKCHRVKPPSHDENFTNTHGQRAKINKETCFVCHDDKVSNTSNVQVGCVNCHPSIHYQNKNLKNNHPIPLEPHQKVELRCYQCHPVDVCAKCHKGSDKGYIPPKQKNASNDNTNISPMIAK